MSKRERKSAWVIALLALGIVLGLGYVFITSYMRPHVTLRLGDGVFRAELARTEAERTQGLSGRSALPNNHAMLFVFDGDDKHSIWMRDMRIDIDIVWLNRHKEVVHIVRNASPWSYPNIFEPTSDARYVVELAAGVAEQRNIRIGTTADFDLNEIKGVER